ncbi:2-oxo acid dehydrogenase subunit E2 [Mucilaginibacter sp. Bleaf8]|uniref:dihydrolipoamide acetyltransferase family protein n=1 Tax=Mucilaginibacter sp. Bleaf8 TaxID=2834430 RepID=UPI001BCE2FDE|nr:dihydrolipoamide acetyltransferase family protein [Mucilaginibacter sp. Bleaf8]MBS7563095.1 2-oxo acid dehydrogenase subunit E2 [Mucilaginibacter sp. Bleaf8]
MARYQLLLPKMGESVAEATVINWLKNPGDYIEADDAVVEIATDKVDSEVPSPVSGKLVEQLFQKDEVVQVGDPIAIIETDNAQNEEVPVAATPEEKSTTEKEPEAQAAEPTNVPGMEQLQQRPAPEVQSAVNNSSVRFYSPLVRNIANQEGINVTELDAIPGTGADGRLTKDDLLTYLNNRQKSSTIPNTVEAKQETSAPKQPTAAQQPAFTAPAVSISGSDEIIEMDRMRKLIADHMIMSRQTSAHVTSFVEADVTNLVLWRERNKSKFEKREGEKITYTPIFIEAVAKAIADMPMVNVSVKGTQIIKKKNINIGMATALPNGNLIVPVIKHADTLNLVGLVKAVNDLAIRARQNKLRPDETQEGTFTITNIAAFGNVMGTPIINQPQVAILAIGAIKKKPAVLETPTGDVIAIRHMMFLSLSYDHRVVDGSLGGMFLKRVADYLEAWDINREV